MKKVGQKHGGSITLAEKGDVLNPNGPKRKLVGSLIVQLKEEGYEGVSPSQIVDIISLLLNLDKERIKVLAEDGTQPIYIQRTARRLYTATDKEIGDFIDKQLDRAHGKPKQVQEITGKDGEALVPTIITVRLQSQPPQDE